MRRVGKMGRALFVGRVRVETIQPDLDRAGSRLNRDFYERVRRGWPAAGDRDAHTYEHTHGDEYTYCHANADRYIHTN